MYDTPTLSNDAADHPKLAQIFDCYVCDIRLRSVQICPSQKASCPVTLAGFMIGDEFIVVDRPVCPIQSICTLSATIVG